MIKLGQKVRFNPYEDMRGYGVGLIRGDLTGTVILVHPSHRYFIAEYGDGEAKFKTSFKFNDVYGQQKSVYIVKE